MSKKAFIGRKLREARMYRGKTIDVLAKETNINKKDILAFEENKYKPTVENALKLSFKWLYSDTFISVMQSLENVSDGEYYLAFKGISDNSHPMVKSIKFMKTCK